MVPFNAIVSLTKIITIEHEMIARAVLATAILYNNQLDSIISATIPIIVNKYLDNSIDRKSGLEP